MEQRKITDCSREETYEIKLRNPKEETTNVLVVKRLWGDWKITWCIHDDRLKDARTVEFPLPEAGSGQTTLNYTVRCQW